MATQKQIAANRRNAQRSTGPRTPEGKIASSRNSFRSGIYADRETILPTEDPSALDELRDEYYDHYQPSAPAERCLVDCLVSDEWLLRRFRRVEGELLTETNSDLSPSEERFCVGTSYKNSERSLERLQRRINATRKSYLKTLEALEAFRAAAEAQSRARERALAEDVALVRAASQAPQNQSLPSEIGFVPSTPSPASRAPAEPPVAAPHPRPSAPLAAL